MADLHKFTTKEVLNKVLLDSSGNSVAALSHTSQEALNAVLDSANSRLNVSLVGGTISGDVTIAGDLTINGDSAANVSEVITGTMEVTSSSLSSFTRTSTETDAVRGTLYLKHQTTGNMIDGFGTGLSFQIRDSAGADNDIAHIFAIRDGGDGQGALTFSTNFGGGINERMRITTTGDVQFGTDNYDPLIQDGSGVAAGNVGYSFKADTDTGMTSGASSNTLLLVTGGVARMTVTSAGHIKIPSNAEIQEAAQGDSGNRIKLKNNSNGDMEFNLENPAYSYLFTNTHTATTALTSTGTNSAFVLDVNKTGVTADGVTVAKTSMHIDMDDTATNHANATVTQTGLDIDVTSANVQGTIKNVGLDVNVSGADTNISAHLQGTSGGFTTSGASLGTTGSYKIDMNGSNMITFHPGASNIFIKDNYNFWNSGGLSADAIQVYGGTGTTGAVLRLKSRETTVVADDVLGSIQFSAPLESSGSDAILVGASIHALASGAFQAGDNPTDLVFSTGLSEAATEKMRITSAGNVGIGTSPSTIHHIHNSGATQGWTHYTNSSTGTTGDDGTHVGTNGLNAYIWNREVGSIYFGTSATARMILDDNSRISLSNNDSGTSNTIFGKSAGASLDAGSNYNVFIGENVSDASMNDASYNTAVGYSSLSALTEGDNNVAVGAETLENLTTGGHNTCIGKKVLNSAAGAESNNVAIGSSAMQNTNQDNTIKNIAIGVDALNNTNTRTCAENVFIGYASGNGNWAGTARYNVAVGMNTMQGALNGAENNVVIGHGAEISAVAGTNQIAIGQGVTGIADNTAVIGNASITKVYMAQDANDSATSQAEGAEILAKSGYFKSIGLDADSGGTDKHLLTLHGAYDADVSGSQGHGIRWIMQDEGTNNGETARISSVSRSGNMNSNLSGFGTSIEFHNRNGGTLTKQMTIEGNDARQTVIIHGNNQGSGGGEALKVENDGNNANREGIHIHAGVDSASSAGDNIYLQFKSGDGDAQGGVRCSSTVANPEFFNGSDIRMKKDIKETSIKGLDIIESIPLKEWNWNYTVPELTKEQKEKGEKKKAVKKLPKQKIGIVADDLEKVLPHLVSTNTPLSGWEHIVKEGEDPLKTIPSETELTLVLMKAVQELSARVKELESK